ncbi:hypothetical protein HDU89_004794 [Geranomyces variabilis]|nr:hypothetical protein HDU89_004794 [Geranomyces variabilis]
MSMVLAQVPQDHLKPSTFAPDALPLATLSRAHSDHTSFDGTGVHRLVWETWEGQIPGDHVVHHMDGNPGNNDVDNLAVVTLSENQRLARKGNSNNSSGYNGVIYMWDNVTVSHIHNVSNSYLSDMRVSLYPKDKWRVVIWLDGKRCDLGRSDDLLVAAAMRAKADDVFGVTPRPGTIRGEPALVPDCNPLSPGLNNANHHVYAKHSKFPLLFLFKGTTHTSLHGSRREAMRYRDEVFPPHFGGVFAATSFDVRKPGHLRPARLRGRDEQVYAGEEEINA